jgi:hypothetical protein
MSALSHDYVACRHAVDAMTGRNLTEGLVAFVMKYANPLPTVMGRQLYRFKSNDIPHADDLDSEDINWLKGESPWNLVGAMVVTNPETREIVSAMYAYSEKRARKVSKNMRDGNPHRAKRTPNRGDN